MKLKKLISGILSVVIIGSVMTANATTAMAADKQYSTKSTYTYEASCNGTHAVNLLGVKYSTAKGYGKYHKNGKNVMSYYSSCNFLTNKTINYTTKKVNKKTSYVGQKYKYVILKYDTSQQSKNGSTKHLKSTSGKADMLKTNDTIYIHGTTSCNNSNNNNTSAYNIIGISKGTRKNVSFNIPKYTYSEKKAPTIKINGVTYQSKNYWTENEFSVSAQNVKYAGKNCKSVLINVHRVQGSGNFYVKSGVLDTIISGSSDKGIYSTGLIKSNGSTYQITVNATMK